ncbi:MAG TPA: hypothetical protein VGC79_22220 [Polyangiaceae bacterium]
MDIVALVEKQRAELAAARAALEAAQQRFETAEADLSAVERVARMARVALPSSSNEPQAEAPVHAPYVPLPAGSARKNVFEPNSCVGLSLAILQAEGKPLHGRDLHRLVEQRGTKVQLTTLTSSLSRLSREKRVFKRFGPNTFGLREWPSPQANGRYVQSELSGLGKATSPQN